MWLFDNLFLDQNTPVTINDWVDHSNDRVEPIVEPATSSGGWGPTGDDTSGWATGTTGKTKKDDGFDTLFTADQIAEKAALAVLHPEPPKDIALEIGLAPSDTLDTSWVVTIESNSADVSFDIGGDLNFDIGGDILWAPPDLSPSETVATPSDSSIISAELLTDDTTSSLEITPSEIVSVDSSLPWVTTPTDTALFSIFNEDPTVPDTSASPISLEGSSTIGSDTLIEESSLFSDLSHLSDSGTPPPTIEASTYTHDALPDLTSPHSWDISTDTSLIREQLRNISLPSSSKLKNKLEEFISELHSLDAEDQAVRDAKRNQIAVYQARVDELKAENESRIHALEYEKADLLKEIQEMDNEKNHIQEVITVFKKELEAV